MTICERPFVVLRQNTGPLFLDSVLCAISDYSVMHHLLVVFQGMIGNCNTCSISDLRYFRSVKLTKELCKRTIF